MIYRMMRDIEATLQSQQYPIAFVYNPAQPRQLYGHRGLVEVERDTTKGEVFGPPLGVQQNPRRMGVRHIGVKWTIYAQSGVEGAMRNDHEHECDLYVDAIQIAIAIWAKESGAGHVEVTEARYLSAEERDGSDLTGDVAYLLRFSVPRGVVRRNYAGPSSQTATIAKASTTTQASVDGKTYEDVP